MFESLQPVFSRLRLKFAIATLFFLPSVIASDAGTTTSTFTVQMTVTSSCVINSGSTLNFGSQGVLAANVDNTSTLQVQCTNTTPYTIGLDAGTGTGATVAARLLSNGANTIIYSLYCDSGRTTVWGNTVCMSYSRLSCGAADTQFRAGILTVDWSVDRKTGVDTDVAALRPPYTSCWSPCRNSRKLGPDGAFVTHDAADLSPPTGGLRRIECPCWDLPVSERRREHRHRARPRC